MQLTNIDKQHVELSDEHETNLRQLAHYLLEYPRPSTAFNMRVFQSIVFKGSMPGLYPDDFFEGKECQTVGCALGHGPYAGFVKSPTEESWGEYSGRTFGLHPGDPRTRSFWVWCFDDAWSEVDNTPEGAGLRILQLLNEGLPADANEQRFGEAPLSYMPQELTNDTRN